MNMKKPELLLPAGNLEKLKVAAHYGADAIYVGGQKFGLRSRADNFTWADLELARAETRKMNVKLYVVLNSFFHDADFFGLDEFLDYLIKIEIDSVIVSDIGVVNFVHHHKLNSQSEKAQKLKIHLSTQASSLNHYSALMWKQMGVNRIVLGREVSIKEAGKIKRSTGLEVEMFIHGSMCMSYSGHCTISNFVSGRDSNRGGCNHSCRFKYELDFKDENLNSKKIVHSTFMSSKDLQGLEVIGDFFNEEIDSLKVEGRMKGHMYIGTMGKVYRHALDMFEEKRNIDELWKILPQTNEDLLGTSGRGATLGNLKEKAGADSIEEDGFMAKSSMAGLVLEGSEEDDYFLMHVKSGFKKGETLEFWPTQGANLKFQVNDIFDLSGETLIQTTPNMLVKLKSIPGINPHSFIRKCL